MTLQEIISRYRCDCLRDALAEVESFQREESLMSAIKRAALALDSDGRRSGHQRLLRQASLEEGCRMLLNGQSDLVRCTTFDSLLGCVMHAVRNVVGLGELYHYDTAFRIGAKLGLQPQAVYLHRGVRDGARALGLDCNRESIPVSELPREFRNLPCWQVEDILCIFKSEFSNSPAATSKGRRGRCGCRERKGCA